MENNDAVLI